MISSDIICLCSLICSVAQGDGPKASHYKGLVRAGLGVHFNVWFRTCF